MSQMGDLASEESFDFFFAKTIRSMEEIIGSAPESAVEDKCDTGDHAAPGNVYTITHEKRFIINEDR